MIERFCARQRRLAPGARPSVSGSPPRTPCSRWTVPRTWTTSGSSRDASRRPKRSRGRPRSVPPSPAHGARIEGFRLGQDRRSGIQVQPSLGYLDFLGLLAGAAFVLTDSGGVQEEATVLGIPASRSGSRRVPVTVEQGTNVVVGTRREDVLAARRPPCTARAARADPRALGWPRRRAYRRAPRRGDLRLEGRRRRMPSRIHLLGAPLDPITLDDAVALVDEALLSEADPQRVAKRRQARPHPDGQRAAQVHRALRPRHRGRRARRLGRPRARPSGAGARERHRPDGAPLRARRRARLLRLPPRQRAGSSLPREAEIERRHPAIRIAGTQHGFFPPGEEPAVVERIRPLGRTSSSLPSVRRRRSSSRPGTATSSACPSRWAWVAPSRCSPERGGERPAGRSASGSSGPSGSRRSHDVSPVATSSATRASSSSSAARCCARDWGRARDPPAEQGEDPAEVVAQDDAELDSRTMRGSAGVAVSDGGRNVVSLLRRSASSGSSSRRPSASSPSRGRFLSSRTRRRTQVRPRARLSPPRRRAGGRLGVRLHRLLEQVLFGRRWCSRGLRVALPHALPDERPSRDVALLIMRAFGTIPLALLERNIDFRMRSVCELTGAFSQAAARSHSPSPASACGASSSAR